MWLYGRAIQSNHNMSQTGNEFDAKSMISLLRCARYSRDITSAKLRATISPAMPSLPRIPSFSNESEMLHSHCKGLTCALSGCPQFLDCKHVSQSEVAERMSHLHIPSEVRCNRPGNPFCRGMDQML